MNITVRAQVFPLTLAIYTQVRERLTLALHHFKDSVVSVDVFLRDINGPRGGIDKQVFVRIRLRTGRIVPIETTHANLYAAIRQSAHRSKRAVRRTLSKDRRFAKREVRRLRTLHALGPESG